MMVILVISKWYFISFSNCVDFIFKKLMGVPSKKRVSFSHWKKECCHHKLRFAEENCLEGPGGPPCEEEKKAPGTGTYFLSRWLAGVHPSTLERLTSIEKTLSTISHILGLQTWSLEHVPGRFVDSLPDSRPESGRADRSSMIRFSRFQRLWGETKKSKIMMKKFKKVVWRTNSRP